MTTNKAITTRLKVQANLWSASLRRASTEVVEDPYIVVSRSLHKMQSCSTCLMQIPPYLYFLMGIYLFTYICNADDSKSMVHNYHKHHDGNLLVNNTDSLGKVHDLFGNDTSLTSNNTPSPDKGLKIILSPLAMFFSGIILGMLRLVIIGLTHAHADIKKWIVLDDIDVMLNKFYRPLVTNKEISVNFICCRPKKYTVQQLIIRTGAVQLTKVVTAMNQMTVGHTDHYFLSLFAALEPKIPVDLVMEILRYLSVEELINKKQYARSFLEYFTTDLEHRAHERDIIFEKFLENGAIKLLDRSLPPSHTDNKHLTAKTDLLTVYKRSQASKSTRKYATMVPDIENQLGNAPRDFATTATIPRGLMV
jgi:hypothetical protein